SKDNQSDSSVKVNPDNSPQPNPGKDSPSEEKNNIKTIKFENKEDNHEKNSSKSTEKSPEDNQTLILNLRNIKKITLTSDGNLVIEFNESENNHANRQKTQIITTEQIKQSQELQTIKSHCQKNGNSSLSQQELSKIIGAANSTATEKPQNGNNVLLIGVLIGGIGVALIFGVGIGLLLKKKK
ncbi:5932_t:CDS:1, partial [Ambispora leptoticha]